MKDYKTYGKLLFPPRIHGHYRRKYRNMTGINHEAINVQVMPTLLMLLSMSAESHPVVGVVCHIFPHV